MVTIMSHLHTLVQEAITAGAAKGLKQKEVASLSGLGEAGLSRLKKAEDARLSTLIELGRSVGLRLVWVGDSSLAELVRKGELFDD